MRAKSSGPQHQTAFILRLITMTEQEV